MIITCNCGEKKFTLPDNSIPASGRMVQCGYCGLKWKQFPVEQDNKTQSIKISKKLNGIVQTLKKQTKKKKIPKKLKKEKAQTFILQNI